MHEMRCDAEQHAALPARLQYQSKVPLFEIADAAVDEPRRHRRRAAPEIALVHEGGAQAAKRRVARDPGARDPAADDEQVHRLRGHRGERGGARAM